MQYRGISSERERKDFRLQFSFQAGRRPSLRSKRRWISPASSERTLGFLLQRWFHTRFPSSVHELIRNSGRERSRSFRAARESRFISIFGCVEIGANACSRRLNLTPWL